MIACCSPRVLAVLSFTAARWCLARGYTLYYGDAEAHLNIARRILDSRTPGPEQIGTVWLPLPHLLMLPFVMRDAWWRSGMAGVIPSAICFVLAGTFLFAAARRVMRPIGGVGRGAAVRVESESPLSAVHAHDGASVSGRRSRRCCGRHCGFAIRSPCSR